ncbi:MAG: zinc ABC transporter solute-binding protein [Leptolyngbyaceae cyanobacterium CSU_1_3]|nr:zinc ABC transporter solute-binding protein [Leptolyngbyaceae cyanobacterium CSU_1_3]
MKPFFSLKPQKQVSFAIALLCVLFVNGCGPSRGDRSASGKPQVVATSTILADLTAQIGADEIQLTGILTPGTDPHVYEPVPADSVALEKANLILYNGYDLEPGLIKLMKAAGSNARQVPVGEVVPSLQLEKAGRTVPDPHVWGSAKNTIRMAEKIRDVLIELEPVDRDRFIQNADRLIADLTRLDRWITQQIQTIPPNRRKLVTTHDAFQYYGQAYSLTIVGTLIGISTEEQPSAQTVKKLVETIKAAGVPAIFAETTINPTLIETVAQEAGVKLAPQRLYSDSIGTPDSNGGSYIKMMVANTTAIVEALGGNVSPFPN